MGGAQRQHAAQGDGGDYLHAGLAAGLLEVLQVDGDQVAVVAVVQAFADLFAGTVAVGDGHHVLVQEVVDLPELRRAAVLGTDALLAFQGAAAQVLGQGFQVVVRPGREQRLGGFGGGHHLGVALHDAAVLHALDGLEALLVVGEGREVAFQPAVLVAQHRAQEAGHVLHFHTAQALGQRLECRAVVGAGHV
ncbi:hypothetical protein D3C78_1400390 [compost metagenome]